MTPLIEQRCFHHLDREAVVRCPGCRRFYCRECVTEHDGRMMCAACASGAIAPAARPDSFAAWIAAGSAGMLLAWAIFYYGCLFLARIPSDFFSTL
jgi:hypothetical protein